MLRKHPGFTAIAVLMLALGIGANSTVFSVAKAVLFRPLGMEEPGRVAWISFTDTVSGKAIENFSWTDFTELRASASGFSEMALIAWPGVIWENGDHIEPLTSLNSTPELFKILDVRPVLGRLLTEADGQPGAEPVALITYEFWQKRFAGDPTIIGRSLRLSETASTVVGILPAGIEFPIGHAPAISTGSTVYAGTHDIWLPLAVGGADRTQRGNRMFPIIGRLKPGTQFPVARAELAAIGQRWAADFPALNRNLALTAIPYRDKALGPAQKGIHVLTAAVAAVLVICCVNLANLLLARGVARHRELAVRHALGASRARTIRALLAECGLLSLGGGALGILLASYAVQAIRRYGPPEMPFLHEITIDATVVAITAVISIGTGLIFGFLPALWQSRVGAGDALKSGVRSSVGPEIRSWQRSLLIGQIALALVLVVAATLLLESFRRLMSVDIGYQPRQVITADLGNWAIPTNEETVRLYREIARRVAALPGVEAVGTIQSIPLTGKWTWEEKAQVRGAAVPESEQPSLAITFVAFDYFKAMQIPIVAGRFFGADELRDDGYGKFIIINEAAARALFPGRSALGQSFSISSTPDRFYEVVGVVRDTRDVRLEEKPQPRFYLNYAHGGSQLLVRSSAPAAATIAMMRATLKQFGSRVMINDIKTMSGIVSDTVAERRFLAMMLTIYAAIALLLAATGIFGVAAYQVAQRTNEFGIRLALGATPARLMRLVLSETFRHALLGATIGLVLAFAVAQLLASHLYEVSPHDPVLFATATLLLFAIGLIASLLPARRAAKVEPVESLRCD
jgi:putative ABC transport system permease protein